MRIVGFELGEAAGHRHLLDLDAVLRTVTVAPGEVLEVVSGAAMLDGVGPAAPLALRARDGATPGESGADEEEPEPATGSAARA